MRIKRVSVFTIKNNLEGKVWNPKIRWLVKYSVLVEIRLDAGKADCHIMRQLESTVTSWGLARISPGRAVRRSRP